MIGNYSLADQLTGVGLTPLGEDVLNDPRAMQRMGNDLAGMSAYQGQDEGPAIGYGTLFNEEPAGAAYGQQGSSFYTPTQEDDSNAVFDIFKTMIGAPFNILRGAKEGLEEIIGHPYAAERDAQEQYIMAMSALRDPDKALIGMPVDRTGINDRQTNPSTVATGTAGGTSANMQPVRSWLPDLITGEKRKRRQRELAQIEANLKAQGIKLNLQSLQAGIYKDIGAGTNSFAGARKTGIEADQLEEFGPQEWRGKIAKLGAETFHQNQAGYAQGALAGKYSAEGGLAKARADKERALTPAEVYRTYQQGNRAAAGADKDWSIAGTNEARRPSLLDYDAARVETEKSKAVRNYGSTAATLGKMQNDGEVATGVKREVEFDKQTGGLKKQASNLLSGNISGGQAQSVEDVSNWLGVPMKTTDTWWPFDETTSLDWDAYVEKNKPAAGVVKKAEEKSVWEALSNLRTMVEEATKKAETGAKPVPTAADPAQPAMPEPTINPVTIDDYDKVVPQLAKTSEVRDFLIQKYGLAETQAREVARALYYRRGGK